MLLNRLLCLELCLQPAWLGWITPSIYCISLTISLYSPQSPAVPGFTGSVLPGGTSLICASCTPRSTHSLHNLQEGSGCQSLTNISVSFSSWPLITGKITQLEGNFLHWAEFLSHDEMQALLAFITWGYLVKKRHKDFTIQRLWSLPTACVNPNTNAWKCCNTTEWDQCHTCGTKIWFPTFQQVGPHAQMQNMYWGEM